MRVRDAAADREILGRSRDGRAQPGEREVRECQGYLRACLAANGDPAALGSGPWDQWADRQLDAINLERAARFARGDRGVPQAMLEAIGTEYGQPEP